MRYVAIMVLGLFLLAFSAGGILATEKGPVDTVLDGCNKEIEMYCKNVTPGEGRLLACLYAYGDKLSPRCEYSLYDASVQLQRAVTALTYVANECRDDLEKYCSTVKPGEGRILNCLEKNKGKISKRCNQAIKDVGIKK